MSMEDALLTFVSESRELLEQMEDALLHYSADPEQINSIFRAAHTIKGSAGLFGLDGVVAFTHVAESVLDRVRSGELEVGKDLITLLLASGDHIGQLVSLVESGSPADDDLKADGKMLVDQLRAYLSGGVATVMASVPIEQEVVLEKTSPGDALTDNWHISIRFNEDVLRNGMDPAAFLRYLSGMGEIISVVSLTDRVPALSDMDPETCYLGFEISFASKASKADIDATFDFVRDGSRISIIPPRSQVEAYIAIINSLPEEDLKLGEILVRCGTLTESELKRALIEQQDTESVQPIGEMLVEQNQVHAPVVEAALARQKQVKDSKAAQASSIRVDSARLDHLISLVGELIIVGSSASLIASRIGESDLLEVTSNMTRMVEEVRDSAMSLRMVQIGATFSRFQRVVHDVSQELGKDIRLEIHGGETELDKTVVEKITDPLTHLVRNAMDHGIEVADVRLARGKPAQGCLRLNAWHDSGSIMLEVADDGGGLNTARIRAKAVERGLIGADAELSDHEIHQLIFEAGFSTADAVSNLSGRGVGMDVVRSNITALRGSVELLSQPGEGTTVRVRLPLTLAIIDGFQVGVGQERYVIPLEMVEECIEFNRNQAQINESGFMDVRGEVLPFVRLRQLFEQEGQGPARQNIVVLNFAGKRAGVVVDSLHGELQTVIRPLGKMFRALPGISGFTILGTGNVALVMDVGSLIAMMSRRDQQATGRAVVTI